MAKVSISLNYSNPFYFYHIPSRTHSIRLVVVVVVNVVVVVQTTPIISFQVHFLIFKAVHGEQTLRLMCHNLSLLSFFEKKLYIILFYFCPLNSWKVYYIKMVISLLHYYNFMWENVYVLHEVMMIFRTFSKKKKKERIFGEPQRQSRRKNSNFALFHYFLPTRKTCTYFWREKKWKSLKYCFESLFFMLNLQIRCVHKWRHREGIKDYVIIDSKP